MSNAVTIFEKSQYPLWSKAAKAANKARIDYVDETKSMISGVSDADDYSDYDEDEHSFDGEVSKNWEKIAQDRRLLW